MRQRHWISLIALVILEKLLVPWEVGGQSFHAKQDNTDDCYSRSVDLVFAVPETEELEVELLQRHSLIQLLDLFAAGEENLTRVNVALIKLEERNNHTLMAKTVFNSTRYQTRAEVEAVMEHISMRNVTTVGEAYHWKESTAYSNKHVGKRFWSYSMVVMLLYDASDDMIRMAVDDGRTFAKITDRSIQSKLLVYTDRYTPVLVDGDERHAVQVRLVTSYTDAVFYYLDESMCAGCVRPFFSSLDHTKCYGLTPEHRNFDSSSNIEYHWNLLVNNFCLTGNAANIETEKEYIYVKRKIETILTSEGSSLESPKTTNVVLALTKDSSSFAKDYKWSGKTPLVYNKWLDEETLLNSNGRDCVVWIFKPGNNESQESMTAGWRQIDCRENIPNGRPLCEYKLSDDYGAAERGNLQMTPLLEANRQKDEILHIGNYVRMEMSVQGRVELRYYMPTFKLLCYFLKCSHPWDSRISFGNLERTNGIKVSVPSLPNVTTFNQFKGIDFSRWLFRCGKISIPYTYVCDGVVHCLNRADENRCGALDPASPQHVCNTEIGEHNCGNNRCIPIQGYCDLYNDCEESETTTSDEDPFSCKCVDYDCGDGRCIPQPYGQANCLKMSSLYIRTDPPNPMSGEAMSYDPPTFLNVLLFHDTNLDNSCAFFCNRWTCVTADMLGNGVIDCYGSEGHIDETWGRLEAHWCRDLSNVSKAVGTSWSPRCILLRDRFGEIIGCRTREHLEGCERFECPESYVKCPENYCIPAFTVNDGTPDCPKGEDERGRDDYIEGDFMGMFKCDKYRYIHPELVCDGYKHCKDGSDEGECQVLCRDGFLCLGDAVVPFGNDHPKTLNEFSFIDKRVRLLSLSNVEVPSFFDDYPSGNLRYLLYLILSNSSITSLEITPSMKLFDASDKDFLTVIHLDLSRNLFTNITEGSVLQAMPFLMSLDLSYNTDLKFISPEALRHVPKLDKLDLSWCGLTHLPRGIFLDHENLETVSLQGTQILHLNVDFGASIQFLNLQMPALQTIKTESFLAIQNIERIQMMTFRFCCPQILGPTIPVGKCHAPTDALSSCYDLMRDPMLRMVLWIAGTTTLLGNLLVIVYRMVIDKSKAISYCMFVCQLGMSDLLMGIYLLIIASMDAKFRGEYVLHESHWRHSIGCKIAGFLSTLSSETSAMFIFLITLDRFLVIKFPFGQIRFTKLALHISCVIVWVIGFIIALVPLLPPFHHWSIYSTNGMCLGLPLSVERAPGWHYSVSIFVGFNFLLFLLIAAGQYAIFRSYFKNIPDSIKSTAAAEIRRKQEITIAKRLSFIVFSDFLCWFPIGIMGFMAMSGYDIGNEAYAWSAVVVLPINSALNPILYTLSAVKAKLAEWQESKSTNKLKGHRQSATPDHPGTSASGTAIS